jgi:hypothetical protein
MAISGGPSHRTGRVHPLDGGGVHASGAHGMQWPSSLFEN